MCGRYCLDENPQALVQRFALAAVPRYQPRWNIAPGTLVLAIHAGDAGRVGEAMTWGLAPRWARRAGRLPQPINARAETLAQRPMFRAALHRHRCILPASGFYEWQTLPSVGGARPRKQPWYVHPSGLGVFALAGLFEPGEAGEPASCCIVTTDANPAMAPIHDRMPVLLDDGAVQCWLDPGADAREVAALLHPCPAAWLLMHPVSAVVNAARAEGAALIQPLPPAG